MIYNILLSFFILAIAPKIFWQVWRKGKNVPKFKDRFGFSPPVFNGSKKRIWFHAVSLGEIKATKPLVDQITAINPDVQILITTSTRTGFDQAKQLFSSKAEIRYLPLDFSWIMERWIFSFRPHLLIFVEGDLWPNLLNVAHRFTTKTILVSGKISQKSTDRFRFFRFVSQDIFGKLDLICAQNEEYKKRFESLISEPIYISGNLKLDIQPMVVDPTLVRNRFSLSENQKIITISCTHSPEEKELLLILRPLWDRFPDLIIFLAPRHPERFDQVAKEISYLKLPFCRWNQQRIQERLVLVDALGQLPFCYSVSNIAIMAGSFSSRIGGHNVLEPCFYGCPVLFGPHMHAQKEFMNIVLQAGVGRQVSEDFIVHAVLEWFDLHASLRIKTFGLIEKNRGCSQQTIQLIEKKFEKIWE